MTRFRSGWLALVGAGLLLALSTSAALGVHPERADNRGQQVSAFVHGLIFGSEEPAEEEELTDEELTDEELTDEEPLVVDEFTNHGHCVREVAKSLEVGGANENHGGAVSLAARVTCWETEPVEPTEEDELTEDELTEDELTDTAEGTTAAAATQERGKSAAAHDRAKGKAKADGAPGNGRGHGRR